MAATKKLEPAELEAAMSRLPGWVFDGEQILRTWTFPSFPEAVAFVDRVALIAEAAGHHPDIDIRYKKVRLALVTHDSGGITSMDIEMAERLNAEL